MPDWVHLLLFMLIWLGSMVLFYLLLELPGLVVGILLGRWAAILIVSRIPGFWNE